MRWRDRRRGRALRRRRLRRQERRKEAASIPTRASRRPTPPGIRPLPPQPAPRRIHERRPGRAPLEVQRDPAAVDDGVDERLVRPLQRHLPLRQAPRNRLLLLPLLRERWEQARASLAGSADARRDVALFCACGAVGQLFIFYTIARFGSLTNTIITTTRKFFNILLSCCGSGRRCRARSGPRWRWCSRVWARAASPRRRGKGEGGRREEPLRNVPVLLIRVFFVTQGERCRERERRIDDWEREREKENTMFLRSERNARHENGKKRRRKQRVFYLSYLFLASSRLES